MPERWGRCSLKWEIMHAAYDRILYALKQKMENPVGIICTHRIFLRSNGTQKSKRQAVYHMSVLFETCDKEGRIRLNNRKEKEIGVWEGIPI